MADPTITLALAGDTMLGRGVAEVLERGRGVFSPEIGEMVADADLFVVNLECCISERGERWRAPGKPFFFRAPPRAAEVLRELGVDAVTLGNNHALDFGVDALHDTFDHLDAAGIAYAGAGRDEAAARAAAFLEARGLRIAVVSFCDHARDFAAGGDRPGIGYADLRRDPLGGWVGGAIATAHDDGDAVVVCPHWGPNMTERPVEHVHRSAAALCGAGATLVAGHSAHVPHGAAGRVLYDLGDFLDDYAVDAALRNDLGLLFLVRLEASRPISVDALPLALDYCHTRPADGADAKWVLRRFASACAELGAEPTVHRDRVTVALS